MSDRSLDHHTQNHLARPKGLMENGACFAALAGLLTVAAILLQWALHLIP